MPYLGNQAAEVSPTDTAAWITDLRDGDHFLRDSEQHAAVAGFPNITVPARDVFGLPIGVSFFGRALSKLVLMKIACPFEHATQAHNPPNLLPKVKLT